MKFSELNQKYQTMWGFRAALAMGAIATACSARAPGDTRPNLILYFPDTISSEAMGPMFNNPIVQTPVSAKDRVPLGG